MKGKKITAALCALAVVVSSSGGLPFSGLRLSDIAITASAATIDTWTSGSCTLTLDDAGKLTVSGNGAMDNYNTDEYGGSTVPWYDVRNSVTSVVISDGVTEIGDYAFSNFDNLTSLSIADTVTNIGERAFMHCDSLNTITIPSSITSIGSDAFYSSTYGRRVTFIRPESESSLTVANGAFYYSAKLFYSDDGNYSLFEGDTEMELTGELSKGDKLNGKTLTWKLPIFSITDNSVNGSVTASVDGADVTSAEAGETVTLTVKPDTGYKLKTISISTSKEKVEEFSDLVSLMGTAVFAGDNDYDFSGYTCKVEDNKFVVYNGTTLVAETENISDFNVGSYGVSFNCGVINWSFSISDNKITRIMLFDTSDYWNSLFVSVYPSESNGTLPPSNVELTTVTEGSKYSFTMPKKNVTVKTEFEEGDEPQIDPTYTITIPSAVSIDGGTAEFKAENVTLPDGAKINITVDGDNTEIGKTTFNAKNDAKDSTVQYTINNGSADVADGGTALTFTEGGTQTLTFAKVEGSNPTYAGTHTEMLTFGISVQDTATTAPSLASVFDNNSTITVYVTRGHRIAGTVFGTGGYDFEYKDGVFTATSMPNAVRPVCAVTKLDDTHFVVKYSPDTDLSITSIEYQGVDGLDIYTFDTTTNTYTYHPATWGTSSNYYTQIDTISVNGVDIPVTQA